MCQPASDSMIIRSDRLAKLSVGTDWTPIEIMSEPFISVTFRGYAAATEVRVVATGLQYTLFIGAKSLTEPIERFRLAQGGKMLGLKLAIKKSDVNRTAPYEVRLIS